MKIIEERFGTIYIIKFPNGKCYIGQTKRSLAQRGSEHIKEYSGCIKLRNAFLKYGHEDCIMETLKTNIQEIYLDYWENFYIDQYDSISNGYNIKYNSEFAIPTDLGLDYVPVEPKPNPFAKFAYSHHEPPRKKIKTLVAKNVSRKKTEKFPYVKTSI